jgi:PAS domain S-box-containing protein
MLATGLRGPLPVLASVLLANGMYAGGALLRLDATRRFLRAAPLPGVWYLTIVPLLAAMTRLTLPRDLIQARVAILGAVVGAIAILIARELFSDATSPTCLIRVTGFSRHELLHHRIWDLDLLTSAAAYATVFQGLIGKPPVIFESRHRRKNGSQFLVEISISVLLLGGRHVAQAFVRDISARKDAEELLRRSNQDWGNSPTRSPMISRNRCGW